MNVHKLIARMDLHWDGVHCRLPQALFAEVKDALRDQQSALHDLYALIEKGDLVRDITNDSQPDWAMKMIPFMRALQNAQRALET